MNNDKDNNPTGLRVIEGGKPKRGRGSRITPDKALTAKQDKFARLVGEGKTQADAYREAYNRPDMSDRTAIRNAIVIARQIHVSQAIGKYATKSSEAMLNNGIALRQFILERLHKEATDAGTDAARIKALELLGKAEHVGMFRERIATEQDERTPDEIRQALHDKLKLAFGE